MFNQNFPTNLVRSALFFVLVYTSAHAATPGIVAHRGASHDAPENTVPAVILAWDKGADATEVDIHMTRDHQIVVIHDSSTKRTTDSNFKIAEVDYQQLMPLDAGKWKNEKYKGTRIPLLSEVLTKVPAGKRIFIEIKCPSTVLPYLQKVVASSGLSSKQTVFIAFDWGTIREAKKRFPKSDCFWLSGFKKHKVTGQWEPSPDQVIERALEAGVDGVDVYHGGPVDKEFVNRARAKGLEVHVYTVNERDDARRLAEAGVDGITTDRAAYLRAGLNKNP
jgi:glycerophosphoryl diester phosphodiesterase